MVARLGDVSAQAGEHGVAEDGGLLQVEAARRHVVAGRHGPDVRRQARGALGVHVQDPPDQVDLCFLPHGRPSGPVVSHIHIRE